MTANGTAPAAAPVAQPGRVLSVAEVVQLVGDQRIGFTPTTDPTNPKLITITPKVWAKGARIGTRSDGTGGAVALDPAFRGNVEPFTITKDEWIQRQIIAASIIWAESRGDTDARCFNIDGPDGRPTCSKTGPAGPRGTDRGIWQWNNKAWPGIPDETADNPEAATMIAFLVTRGWAEWGPWRGSQGLDPESGPSKTISAEFENQWGIVRDDSLDFLPDGLLDWTKALAKLLGNLLSGAWWRRVGVFALGVALVVLAVVLTLAPAATDVAKELL